MRFILYNSGKTARIRPVEWIDTPPVRPYKRNRFRFIITHTGKTSDMTDKKDPEATGHKVGREAVSAEEIDSIRQSDLELYEIMASGLELEFSDVIFALTHKRLEEDQAQELWGDIQLHQQELKNMIGRDPGVLVAALDFLYNIRKELAQPTIMEQHKIDNITD